MLRASMMFRLMVVEGAWMMAVMGVVYNVGDSAGWTTLINSSYSAWASSKTFRVGDTLLFHYNPADHNVMQVNQTSFRSCNIMTPLKTYGTGNDIFIIAGPGHYYFICSFPGHCYAGQKLDVRVLKKNSPSMTPAPPNATEMAPPKTTAMAPQSVANVATDPAWLVRSIVVFITCVAMWTA